MIQSKDYAGILGARYKEVDIDEDGRIDKIIEIPLPEQGEYQVTVTPEQGAAPNDTFSMEIMQGDETTVIKEDTPISEIDGTPETITYDITAPEIALSVTPNILWPPNHKMVLITPNIIVTDNCDPNPIIKLKSITMDEGEETNTYDPNYDSTVGDGNTDDDIQVDESGNIYLRAERSGTGDGRL